MRPIRQLTDAQWELVTLVSQGYPCTRPLRYQRWWCSLGPGHGRWFTESTVQALVRAGLVQIVERTVAGRYPRRAVLIRQVVLVEQAQYVTKE